MSWPYHVHEGKALQSTDLLGSGALLRRMQNSVSSQKDMLPLDIEYSKIQWEASADRSQPLHTAKGLLMIHDPASGFQKWWKVEMTSVAADQKTQEKHAAGSSGTATPKP